MDTKIDLIILKINKLEQDIQEIKNIIQINSYNIDTHIDFIENVYDTVKSPFYYIMNFIKPIKELPKLINKSN